MYGLLWLLPTSGENFMSTAPLEIYLLRKMLVCSILILPAVNLNDLMKSQLLQKDKTFTITKKNFYATILPIIDLCHHN